MKKKLFKNNNLINDNISKKKGFTLLELLGVIIVTALLLLIAIPAVTRYIARSKVETYLDTVRQIIGAARNVVNEGKLDMFDTDTTYYMDTNCVKLEGGLTPESPNGEFDKAYVVAIYDGKKYTYYFTGRDEYGEGVRNIVQRDELKSSDFESGIESIDTKRGLGFRSKVAVLSKVDGTCKKVSIDNSTSNVAE